MVAAAGGAALAGLLHATAAGAVVVAGLALAVPGAVEASNPLEAAAQAVAFGLACLRVPLESGGVHGTFAPLSGLLLTLWGLASAARRGAPKWPGRPQIAATGTAFSIVCAGAAGAAGALTTIEPSVPGAALAGLLWGSVGAALRRFTVSSGAYPNGTSAGESGAVGASAPRRCPPAQRVWRGLAGLGPPALAPGIVAAGVGLGLATVWFLVVVAVGLGGGSTREITGGILLAVAVGPNAAAGLVAVGLGGSVEVVLHGTLLPDPLVESLSIWRGAGAARLYVLLLVPAAASAALAGGRAAASTSPHVPALARGLATGSVFGGVLLLAGWAGALAAGAAGDGEAVSAWLGFPSIITFALAVLWCVAGAFVGPRLPWPKGRSRVGAP